MTDIKKLEKVIENIVRKQLTESEQKLDVIMTIMSHLSDIQEQVNSKLKGEINFCKALLLQYKSGKKEMSEDDVNVIYNKWVK